MFTERPSIKCIATLVGTHVYTHTLAQTTCAVCVATLKYPRDKVSFIITVVPETHRADGPSGRRGVITQGDSHVRTEVNRGCTVVINQGL